MLFLWQHHGNAMRLKISENVLNRKERMSDDLMELISTKLNYIYFETDSDDSNSKSDEKFVLQKSLFSFEQFSTAQTSEGFSIRDILCRKTHCVFRNKEFFLVETVCF